NAALFDVGTRFLQRLAAISSFKTAASAGNNPWGGGAEPAPSDRYRTWFEGYGLSSRTDAQIDFAGDRRKTFGAVAGAAANIAPGATVGIAVDQGRTNVDVTNLPPGFTQDGRIDLTQIGLLAAFQNGPWSLGSNVIYGFGRVHSSRFEFGGTSNASYLASLWGVMTELSYYWALPNNSRFIPKLTVDWIRSRTDPFTEAGGFFPVAGSSVTSSRLRMMIGGELGHSWLADRTLLDFSIYARLVDNLSQNIGALELTDADGFGGSRLFTGIRESNLGADAGATLSARITETARLYAVYDGRYRSNFMSHSGTIGAEFRF
ncbi:MAG: autotransporter outer membrane beta-barrel domain-containing protein, partial [Rhizobiales bacterium]|nr:autotransporter outer membrane beta-barrel domain-containing protein [Hyphomicrobiales bacterium]